MIKAGKIPFKVLKRYILGPIYSWRVQQNKDHHTMLNGAFYSAIHLMNQWVLMYALSKKDIPFKLRFICTLLHLYWACLCMDYKHNNVKITKTVHQQKDYFYNRIRFFFLLPTHPLFFSSKGIFCHFLVPLKITFKSLERLSY